MASDESETQAFTADQMAWMQSIDTSELRTTEVETVQAKAEDLSDKSVSGKCLACLGRHTAYAGSFQTLPTPLASRAT